MVVCPGRAFLRRFYDITVNIVNQFHFIRLTCEARVDLQAWQVFIETVFLADTWVTSDHLKLFTDASDPLGYAAVFGSLWFVKA